MRGCDQALASRQAALASGEHDDELLDDCISHTRGPDEASFQEISAGVVGNGGNAQSEHQITIRIRERKVACGLPD